MKKERKFKFVGDPKQWTTLIKGEVFSGNYRITPHSKTILEYKESYPLDWEEVTEQEEKIYFKFVGNPNEYTVIKKGEIVPFGFHPKKWGVPVEVFYNLFPDDWEKVDQEPTWIFEPSNQDQPASEMTKFEKCVIDIICNIYSNINIKTQTPTYHEISQIAINQAKETFKQLDELK